MWERFENFKWIAGSRGYGGGGEGQGPIVWPSVFWFVERLKVPMGINACSGSYSWKKYREKGPTREMVRKSWLSTNGGKKKIDNKSGRTDIQ